MRSIELFRSAKFMQTAKFLTHISDEVWSDRLSLRVNCSLSHYYDVQSLSHVPLLQHKNSKISGLSLWQ